MKVNIVVPSAGESVSEAEIAKWAKKSGEIVKLDDVILELETDKATLEVNAEAEGQLKITVEEGEVVRVGQVIGSIDTSVSSSTPTEKKGLINLPKKETTSRNTSMGSRIDIVVPAAGESVSEANIAQWFKKTGDSVVMDEVLLELETDKASLEVTAETSGKLNIKIQSGMVQVGDVLGFIMINEEGTRQSVLDNTSSPPGSTQKDDSDHYAKGHPSPVASKLMAETGIKSTDVVGSGKDGRILKQDVSQLSEPNVLMGADPKSVKGEIRENISKIPNVQVKGTRIEKKSPMSRLRKTIATRLVDAQRTAAMLTTFNEVDMSAIMGIRKKYKEQFKDKHEIGLGFMSFFTKATCSALKAWPVINASIDGNDIVYRDYCDIGVAVSTPKGLVVPVVRNAELMSFSEIESTILSLAQKGRNGKLTAEDMTGGTFTITNGGTFGSMLSTPILNKPQSAILGMHNIVNRPVAVGDNVEIRPVMYLAVTYDHRLIDGAEAVQFLVHIKECIEDPTRILLDI